MRLRHARQPVFDGIATDQRRHGGANASAVDGRAQRDGGTAVNPELVLKAYCAEASTWDLDRSAARRRETRVAWLVGAAGWLCALGCTGVLLALMPLKRVEPFVVRVDSSSGVVDVVPGYRADATVAQTVTRYFLTHYVTVCERFNAYTAESDYEECGALNGAQRNQLWSALWARGNPLSPLNVHRDGSTTRAQVLSVSFFKRASGVDDLAQIRYLKEERAANDAQPRVTHWIASIQYAYAQPAADIKTRSFNPLGFKVLSLTAEPEVLPASTAEPSAAATAGASS
jgi:type IV secretion system protein VirB8